MYDAMSKHLDKCEFSDVSYCEFHCQDCPWHPRAVAELADLLWIEVAGSTCIAWSVMGTATHWLHESTLPCLVWAYSLRFAEPDAVLHECTPAFEQGKLMSILNSARVGNDPTPRYHVGRSVRPARYSMRSHITSPARDRDIPTSRIRRYTMFFCDHALAFPQFGFEDVFPEKPSEAFFLKKKRCFLFF